KGRHETEQPDDDQQRSWGERFRWRLIPGTRITRHQPAVPSGLDREVMAQRTPDSRPGLIHTVALRLDGRRVPKERQAIAMDASPWARRPLEQRVPMGRHETEPPDHGRQRS
ncbi:MAG: hypothetical protein ACF787_00170, partial [Rhodopirellula sp. JB053]